MQQAHNKLFLMSPRVVKFSGGRTSGMLLLQLLEKGELKQWRGDCVIFNNTSAEHKATYAFVARLKKITENQYDIPFFMIEYQTYEVKSSRGRYIRRATYKLINEKPYCEVTNSNGYKYKGEVFEELISHKGSLPSVFQRVCTANMKIIVTNNFLKDWFSHKNNIEKLGHNFKKTQITNKDIVAIHKLYKGQLSADDVISRKSFAVNSRITRPKQYFQDFTKAKVKYNNSMLLEHLKSNNKIELFGKKALKFISYIGIRHDEKNRATKIRKRIIEAKGKNAKKSSLVKTQPTNEIAIMPMIKARVNQEKVKKFWQNKKYDLDLPDNGLLSNCVFCPLKSKAKIQFIAKHYDSHDNLPSSITWWVKIEKKYSRKLKENNKNNYTNVGFFGADKRYKYHDWSKELKQMSPKQLQENLKEPSFNMACNCTD